MSFWSELKGLGRNRHYHRGIVHYNRGEYAQAVVAFEKALATIARSDDPDYSMGAFYAAEARAHLALACLQVGDTDAAEQHLRSALENNPDFADLHYHLATILEQRDEVEEARRECLLALELNPEYLRARLLLAVCCDRLGDSWAARDALGKACDQGFLLPSSITLEPWSGLAGQSKLDLLQAEARRSLAQYHLEQGLERYTQDRLPEALAEFELAVEAEPDFPDLRAKRASLLAELDRHEEAVEEWCRALEINPDYLEALVRRGVSLMALGRDAAACADFTRAMELSPDDPELSVLAGASSLADGRIEAATEFLTRAIDDERRGSDARRLLELCRLAESNHGEAVRQARVQNGELVREAVAKASGG